MGPAATARPLARLARFAWELVSGDVEVAARSINHVLAFSPAKLRRVVAEAMDGCGSFVHFGEITYATTFSHAAFRVICSHSEWQLIVHATKDMNEPRFVFGIIALSRGRYRHPSAFVPAVTVPSDYMRGHGIPAEPRWWESDGAESSLRVETTVRVPLPPAAWQGGAGVDAPAAAATSSAAHANSRATLSSASSETTWKSSTTQRGAPAISRRGAPAALSPRARRVPFGLDGGVDDVCVDTIESANPLARHASPASLPLDAARTFRGSAFHVPLLEDRFTASDRAATALALQQLGARSRGGRADPRVSSPGGDSGSDEEGEASPGSPRVPARDLPPDSSRTESVQGPPSLSCSAAGALVGKSMVVPESGVAAPSHASDRGPVSPGAPLAEGGGQARCERDEEALLARAAAVLSGRVCRKGQTTSRSDDRGPAGPGAGNAAGGHAPRTQGLEPSVSDVVSGVTGETDGDGDLVDAEADQAAPLRPRAFGEPSRVESWLDGSTWLTAGPPTECGADCKQGPSPEAAVPAVDSASFTSPRRRTAAVTVTGGLDSDALGDLDGPAADPSVWLHSHAAGSPDAHGVQASELRRGHSDELSVDTAHFRAASGPPSHASSRDSGRLQGTPSGSPGRGAKSELGIRPVSDGSTQPRMGAAVSATEDEGPLRATEHAVPPLAEGEGGGGTEPTVGALHMPAPVALPPPPSPPQAAAAAARQVGDGAAATVFDTPTSGSRSRSLGPGGRWLEAGASMEGTGCRRSPASRQSVDTASERMSANGCGGEGPWMPVPTAGEAAPTVASTHVHHGEDTTCAVAHLCAESSFQLVESVSVLSAEGVGDCAVPGLRWWRFSNAGNVFLAVSVPRRPEELRPSALRVAVSLRLHGGLVASQPSAPARRTAPSRGVWWPLISWLPFIARRPPLESPTAPSGPVGGVDDTGPPCTPSAPQLALPTPLPGGLAEGGHSEGQRGSPVRRSVSRLGAARAAPSSSSARQQLDYAQPFADVEGARAQGGSHGAHTPLLGMRGTVDADAMAAGRAVISTPPRPLRGDPSRARHSGAAGQRGSAGAGATAARPSPTRHPGSLPSPYGAHVAALSLERLEREAVFTEFPKGQWEGLHELRGGDEVEFNGLRVQPAPWQPHRVDATAAGAVGEGTTPRTAGDAALLGPAAPPLMADRGFLQAEAGPPGADESHATHRGPGSGHASPPAGHAAPYGAAGGGLPRHSLLAAGMPRFARMFRRWDRTETGEGVRTRGGPSPLVSESERLSLTPNATFSSATSSSQFEGGQGCDGSALGLIVPSLWRPPAQRRSAAPLGLRWTLRVQSLSSATSGGPGTVVGMAVCAPGAAANTVALGTDSFDVPDSHIDCLDCAMPPLGDGEGHPEWRAFARAVLGADAGAGRGIDTAGAKTTQGTSDSVGGGEDSVSNSDTYNGGWRSADGDSGAGSVEAPVPRGLHRYSVRRCFQWRRAGAKEGFPSILRIPSLRRHRVAPRPAGPALSAASRHDGCSSRGTRSAGWRTRIAVPAGTGGEVDPCVALAARVRALLPVEALRLLQTLASSCGDAKDEGRGASAETLAATVAECARRLGTLQLTHRVVAWCRAGSPPVRPAAESRASSATLDSVQSGARRGLIARPVRRRGAGRRVAPEPDAGHALAENEPLAQQQGRGALERVSSGQDSGIHDRVRRCAVRDLDEESADGSESDAEGSEADGPACQGVGPAYTGLSSLLARGEGKLCALERATVACALLQALAIPCRAVAMSRGRPFAKASAQGDGVGEPASPSAGSPHAGCARGAGKTGGEGDAESKASASGPALQWARPSEEEDGITDAEPCAGGTDERTAEQRGEERVSPWGESQWGVEVYCPSFGWLAFPVEGSSLETAGGLLSESLPFEARAVLGADTLARAEGYATTSHGSTRLPVAVPLEGALQSTRPPDEVEVRLVTARLPPLLYGRACPGSADGRTVSALAGEVEAGISHLKLLGLVSSLRALRGLLVTAREHGDVTPSDGVRALLGSAVGSTELGDQLAARDAPAAKMHESPSPLPDTDAGLA